MRIRSLIAVCLLLGCVDSGAAPAPRSEPVIDRILRQGSGDNRAYEQLQTLCKTFGPRLTGTERFDEAARWAADQFRSFGLDARLEKFGEFPISFRRGYASGGMVTPQTVEYSFTTPAWSGGTGGPKRGPAFLEPTTVEELEALKPRLAGCWLVAGEKAPSARIQRELREAAKPLGHVRSGSRNGRILMGGNPRASLEEARARVEVRLLQAQYADLLRRLQAGEAVELEFDIGNEVGPGPVPLFDVVADLRGTEKPDELVVVGGHLDSWDGAEGAQDNGTGSATTIEAARLIAAAGGKPRRTIRFVLFGGEEEGLLGSVGYLKAHDAESAKTSLVLVHDGGGTALVGLKTTYPMLADFARVFAPVADLDPAYPFRVEESAGLENSGDSDHAPFLEAGVPAYFWEQGGKGYDHIHHTQFDVLEAVDRAQLEHSAVVVAAAAWGFAELDHLLDRTDSKPLARRLLRVSLDGTKVDGIEDSGRAAAAGWKEGDVILSIDGVEVDGRESVSGMLNRGAPKKVVRLKRGEEIVETPIDWSDDPGETERAARESRREAWMRVHPGG